MRCLTTLTLLALSVCAAEPRTHPLPEFPLKPGDTILSYGSSSTMIGVWPQTLEFLLRTRHPELNLRFERRGVGGGNFTMALKEIDKVLEDKKPGLVIFNFGGNDATRGEKGLPIYRKALADTVTRVQAHGARVLFLTPQPGDERLAGARNDYLGLYSQEMLAFARAQGVAALDTYRPLEDMLYRTQNEIPDYSFNKDHIHLSDSAYVAWGFFIYDGLNAPKAECSAELSSIGRITRAERCLITDVKFEPGRLAFTREDEILPILPPQPIPTHSLSGPTKGMIPPLSPALEYVWTHGSELPPRKHCPLETLSQYRLKISGLDAGRYTIQVDGKLLGTASAEQLNDGVNLNSVLLDSGLEAPWKDLALDLWKGKNLNKIGRTRFKFEIIKKD